MNARHDAIAPPAGTPMQSHSARRAPKPKCRSSKVISAVPEIRALFRLTQDRSAPHPQVDSLGSKRLSAATTPSAAHARKIRSTESIMFQLRVVAGAPKSRSSWPRQPIVFMWRRYSPNTSRLLDPITRTYHSSPSGIVIGGDAVQ